MIFDNSFNTFWKQEIKNQTIYELILTFPEVEALVKRAYEQGRFDEANYTGACLQDTENKSRKGEFEI